MVRQACMPNLKNKLGLLYIDVGVCSMGLLQSDSDNMFNFNTIRSLVSQLHVCVIISYNYYSLPACVM